MNPTLPKSIEQSAGHLAEIVGHVRSLAYAYARGDGVSILHHRQQVENMADRLGHPDTLSMLDQAGSDLKEIYNRTK